MGKAAALSVGSSLLYIQAEAKYIKAQPSRAKPEPNFSKERALISLEFLVRNEPFQPLIVTPWAKKFFVPAFAINNSPAS
jgi:hypothetical protein